MKIKERINVYVCEYGCHNITVDIDKGVTPFFIRCEFRGRPDRPADPAKMKNGKCIGLAKSCMYPKEVPDGVAYPKPTHEWHRPDLSEYSKLSQEERDHVKNGGLLLRERTNAAPLINGVDDWEWKDVKIPNYDLVIEKQTPFGKNYFKRGKDEHN